MRKAYQSDLSDPNGAASNLTCPFPNPPDDPGCIAPARSSTPFSTSSAAAVPGDCSLTTSLQQEDRLPLLPLLAFGWILGEDAHRPAPEGAGAPGAKPPAQCWHRRQSVDQNDRGGRSRAWLRRSQEGQRPKAPFTSGHAGIGAPSEGSQRKGDGPGRHQAPARVLLARSPPTPLPPVARRGLHRPREGRRLGREDIIRVDGRDR